MTTDETETEPTFERLDWEQTKSLLISAGIEAERLAGVGAPQLAKLCNANLHGADLDRADLGGADLHGADLYGANLANTNLERANLCDADLSYADLHGADLYGANLDGANLCGADLANAYLGQADLHGADLRYAVLTGACLLGANLANATLNWASHDLIAEILRQAADNDVEKLQVAGLILIARDWCWRDFIRLRHPLTKWALGVLDAWHDRPEIEVDSGAG